MFHEVARLLQIVVTIPVTTATAETTFSVLRRLKTFLRSSMLQPCLNHITILHIHEERTDQLDMLEMARNCMSTNDRRRLYYAKF